jgi:outer membrane biogenesis lipoprotein LolB
MMPMVRKLGAVAAVAMMLMLAACTTSTVKPTGVVTSHLTRCLSEHIQQAVDG